MSIIAVRCEGFCINSVERTWKILNILGRREVYQNPPISDPENRRPVYQKNKQIQKDIDSYLNAPFRDKGLDVVIASIKSSFL